MDDGYGRARLRLGITAVGTWVVVAAVALFAGLPDWIAARASAGLASQMGWVGLFLIAYALLHLPFDVIGGFILPKRYGRSVLGSLSFARTLARGVTAHTLLLWAIAGLLLVGGRTAGSTGFVVAGMIASVALLVWRLPLARCIGSLQRVRRADGSDGLNAVVMRAADEGWTGGVTGLFGEGPVVMPAHWPQRIGSVGNDCLQIRRHLQAARASQRRGHLLAIGFTWTGLVIAALWVGADRAETASGVIEASLLFTLWSFMGLLVLPTPSRAGVHVIDQAFAAALERGDFPGLTHAVVREALIRQDALQDGETQRSPGIERIFHPIPALASRLSAFGTSGSHSNSNEVAPVHRHHVHAAMAARIAILLSAGGLGLLGRAVHCNCGRPVLWVYLPSE